MKKEKKLKTKTEKKQTTNKGKREDEDCYSDSDVEEKEKKENLQNIARALGRDYARFSANPAFVDESLVGKIILYAQPDGLQLVQVVEFFSGGKGPRMANLLTTR